MNHSQGKAKKIVPGLRLVDTSGISTAVKG